jgi:hypothetical protein
MMRYRSEQITTKDMAYLLVMVGLGFFNSSGPSIVGLQGVILLNLLLIGVIVALEKTYNIHPKKMQKIKYDKLELLKPKYQNLLQRDLMLRLGKEIIDIQIDNVNFIEGFATVNVTYGDQPGWDLEEDYQKVLNDHNQELEKIYSKPSNQVDLNLTESTKNSVG